MTFHSSIYLDYNATTPVRPEVLEAMHPFWNSVFANSASRHTAGQEAWRAVEDAREHLADLCGCSPNEVYFTSGATESNFTALLGRFDYLLEKGRDPQSIRIAISAIEHPCVKACAERLRARGGEVHWIPVTRAGMIDLDFFEQDSHWDIISVMAANHETGAIQPLQQIRDWIDPSRTFFHTDAAQWAGRTRGGMKEWGTGALSLSAHKMYGPKGIGVLVLKNSNKITPLIPGAQEAGIRGGTVNVPAAIGFGEAARLMKNEHVWETQRLTTLRERLWSRLYAAPVPVYRTVAPEQALPNTLHVRIAGKKGERIVDALDQMGICCSAGPACASGASEPSPVLRAMGFSEKEAWEGVRFSLGRETTEEEIDRAGEQIHKCLSRETERVA